MIKWDLPVELSHYLLQRIQKMTIEQVKNDITVLDCIITKLQQ